GIGGPAYLTSLVNTVPTSAHVEHYGRIVERAALRRRLIDAAARIAEIAFDEASDEVDDVIDRAEQLVFAVAQRRLARDLVPISKVLYDYFDQIEYLQQHQGSVLGTPSGFIDVDKLLGGFQASDLIIVAGRPGMGKTSLMLSMAESIAAKQMGAIAIFTLEMSSDQLVQRLIASETGIDSQRLRLGQIRDNEIDLVARAIGHLSEMPIYLDDSANISPFELRTKARRLHTEQPLSLVIVDYLQLMTGGIRSENRVQEISYISRSLKALARELRVPVMAASQLSRAVEARHDRRPQLADLRESGCLSGETLVYLPEQGIYRPIEQLVGQNEFRVLALNTQTWHLEPSQVSRVFATGHKPVYRLTTRLGRSIRATTNHQFLTVQGWRRLDDLSMGMRIALPRRLPGPTQPTIDSEELARLARSDVYWDEIVAMEPDGETEVYDLTVEGHHNFVANDIIAHNSIEQDADVVMFIYRDEVYHPDTTYKNVAELIVAKHRNGPTGKVELGFIQEQTKFVNLFREPVGM
ncbi:MAG: replicative DNA helicase, partial [Chloroflexi bacterium RBG_16_57_9]